MGGERESALLLTFARRGEEEAIREALRGLREKLPDAEIAAVGTPVSAPVLAGLGVDDVIVYGEGRGARGVVREARRRGPRAAGIVYGGPGFSAHLKLEVIALGSGAKVVYRFVAEGAAEAVGRLGLLWSVMGKVLRAVLCLAAGGVMCSAAMCWLRLRQMMAGGRGASRA